MKIARLFLLCLILTSVLKVNGADTIISQKIDHPVPYIIINVPSTDCINCRASVTALLEKIRSKVSEDKIILLSDVNSMKSYFNKYPAIFSGYQVKIDEALSTYLSRNLTTTLSLVTTDTSATYTLSKISENALDTILNKLNTPSRSVKAIVDTTGVKKSCNTIKDSVFEKYTNVFTVAESFYYLLNERFQTSAQFDARKNHITYTEPKVSLKKYNSLLSIIKNYYQDSTLLPADSVFPYLNKSTLPIVYFRYINYANDLYYSSFYINTVSRTVSKIREDSIHISNVIRGRNFIAISNKMKNIIDPVNVDYNNRYSMVDTIHYNGKMYFPYLFKGFQVQNTEIFIPYREFVDSSGLSVERKEMYIARFSMADNKKLKFEELYQYKNYLRPEDFFFKVDDKRKPYIISNFKKEILLYNSANVISYQQLHFGKETDTLTYVYDCTIKGNTLSFVGLLNNKETVFGKLLLSDNKLTYKYLSKNAYPFNAIFSSDSILTYYKKNEEAEFCNYIIE